MSSIESRHAALGKSELDLITDIFTIPLWGISVTTKIIFFSNRSAPFRGGVETHVDNICRELAISGSHRVTLISTAPTIAAGRARGALRDYEYVHVNSHKSLVGRLIAGLAPAIVRRSIPSDIVHYHDYGTVIGVGFFTFVVRLLTRQKQFITFHGWEGVFPPKNRTKLIRRLIARLSNGSIHVGSYIAKWYGTSATVTTVGGVGTGHTNLDPVTKCITKDCYFVGRLDSDTGAMEVVSAWGKIVELTPNETNRLIVLGDGPFRGRLEQLVKHSDSVAARTQFSGFVDEPLNRVEQNAVVFTSGYLSILEAFARSTKVISYYNNDLKKDYLASIEDYHQMMWITESIEGLVKCYFDSFKDSERSSLAMQFSARHPWSKVKDDYLRVWSG